MIWSCFEHTRAFKLIWLVGSFAKSFHYDVIVTNFLIECNQWEIFLWCGGSFSSCRWFNQLFVFIWLGWADIVQWININFRQSSFFESRRVQLLTALIKFSYALVLFFKRWCWRTFTIDHGRACIRAEGGEFYIVKLRLNRVRWVSFFQKAEWGIRSMLFYPFILCVLQSTHFICLKKSGNWSRSSHGTIIFYVSLDIWVSITWFAHFFVTQSFLADVTNGLFYLKIWLLCKHFWWIWLINELFWLKSRVVAFWLPVYNYWWWGDGFQRRHAHLFCFTVRVMFAYFFVWNLSFNFNNFFLLKNLSLLENVLWAWQSFMQNRNHRDKHFWGDWGIELNELFETDRCSSLKNKFGKAANFALIICPILVAHISSVLIAVEAFSWRKVSWAIFRLIFGFFATVILLKTATGESQIVAWLLSLFGSKRNVTQ